MKSVVAVVVGVLLTAAVLTVWASRDSGTPLRNSGTPADADHRYTVTGTVVAPPAGGEVQIAHEEIPGYMAAMTMPFRLADARDGERLAVGDRLRFTLRVGAQGARIEDIVVTGRDVLVARAASAPARPSRARLRPGDAVPAFELIDQSGAKVTEADLRKTATVVTFLFTRCPVPEFCPLLVTRFKEIQEAVKKDPTLDGRVRLLAVTLDPEFDTPQVLEEYGRNRGADFSRWRFATGDPEQIAALARAFAVHSEKNGVFLDHTLATALIGEDGRVVEIWRGNGWKASEVLARISGLGQGYSDRGKDGRRGKDSRARIPGQDLMSGNQN
ncbi:MAG TPA: SCO family protein [Vicinamibacterales bacterium]